MIDKGQTASVEKSVMQTEQDLVPASAPRAELMFPGTRIEFVNLMAHYYRGEMGRMTSWRDRIDRTSNWAITVAAALLSVSLSTPNAHHGVVLFAALLVMLLLAIESRRYRFFDVYRSRVRRLERYYFASVFSPARGPEEDWMVGMADSLRRPGFLISMTEAMSRRLRRNYFWMFALLLAAWLLKTTSAKLQTGGREAEFVHSASEWLGNCALGPLPGWVVVVVVVTFYIWITYATFRHARTEGELTYGDVHV
jgi:uncharacterized membrane protein